MAAAILSGGDGEQTVRADGRAGGGVARCGAGLASAEL